MEHGTVDREAKLFRIFEAAAYRAKNRIVNVFDKPVVVLLYHRVTTLEADPQLLTVSPENFRAQLQYLKTNFALLRFEEDWGRRRSPGVAITFDDGYADNCVEALPIIDELGVPVTIFIVTGAVESSNEFWSDELERVLLGDWNFPDRFVLSDRGARRTWETSGRRAREVLYREIHPLMKGLEPVLRENWLDQLRRWAGVREGCRETHRPISKAELLRLARSEWITLGAHSVTHTALAYLSERQQKAEIEGSKLQLENLLGREVSVFSYPFGTKEDYSLLTVKLCKQAGYAKVAANFPAPAHSWTDLYQIPRQIVRNWPVDVFAEKMRRFWIS